MRKMLLLCAIVLFGLVVSGASAVVAAPASQASTEVAGETLVKVASSDVVKQLASEGYTLAPVGSLPNVYKVRSGDAKATSDDLAKRAGVVWAQPNALAHIADGPVIADAYVPMPQVTTNDTYFGNQYSLQKMNVVSAWNISKGDGAVVGIVDTGADFSHPDLQGKFVSRGRDMVNNDYDASDDQGHGTHVSGIAAAATNNSQGMAGVGYNAKFLMCKGLASNGSGGLDVVASCVTWLTDQGVKIISMSLGCACPHPIHEEYVDYAYNHGAIVIAAAGNSGDGVTRFYPASVDNAIGVCATDANDQKASFSNYGPNVDVCAPGVAILSSVRGGGYQQWDGTSMATPNVAGVAALVKAVHQDYTAERLRNAILVTADNLGPANLYGYGRVNAARAVSSSAPSPLPSPTPPSSQPTPTPIYGATPTPNDFGAETERMINVERVNRGLPALRVDSRLGSAADYHNNYMIANQCFAHTCPGEPDPFARMRNFGYKLTTGGENIAAGQETPRWTVDTWMNSTGHRAAILSSSYTAIGCGYKYGANTTYRHYWTCDFAAGDDGNSPTLTPTRVPSTTPTPNRTFTPTPRPLPTRTPTLVPGLQPWMVDAYLLYNARYETYWRHVGLCSTDPNYLCSWSQTGTTRHNHITLRYGVKLPTVLALVDLCRSDPGAYCRWTPPSTPWP